MGLLPILVSAVVAVVVGAIYYAPPFFGRVWVQLTGLKMGDMKKDTVWVTYLMTFAAAVVLCFVLSFLIDFVQAKSITDAIKLGFWLWLGFVATTSLTNTLYSKRPMKLLLLENGHHLLVILVVSIVLVLWK